MTAKVPITVVSDEEAEEVDAVVCLRAGSPSPFTDNETGVCSQCGHAIFFRPYMPKKPRKICVQCLDRLERAE